MSNRPDRVTHIYGAVKEQDWTIQMLINVLAENFAPEDVITVLNGPTHGVTVSIRRRIDES